jgi:hypothetical protein
MSAQPDDDLAMSFVRNCLSVTDVTAADMLEPRAQRSPRAHASRRAASPLAALSTSTR